MRKIFTLLLCMTIFQFASSQTPQVDFQLKSLQKVIAKMKSDSLLNNADTIVIMHPSNYSLVHGVHFVNYHLLRSSAIRNGKFFTMSYEYTLVRDMLKFDVEIGTIGLLDGSQEITECNGYASIEIKFNCENDTYKTGTFYFDIGKCTN
jgi:hypothetical protein